MSATVPATAPAVPATTAHDAVLRPVREGNAFEETVERILQLIKLGVVGVGDRLPSERELASRLGVSRVSVREAIRALQEAGYVESRPGRYGGTSVRAVPRPSRANPQRLARDMGGVALHDILVFRHVVEVGAAELAASRRLDSAEVAHLEQVLDQTCSARPSDYRRADSRLHLALAELSGSTSLTAAVADARVRVNELLDAIPLLAQNIANSDAQHDEVVRAVLARRPTKARRAMTEHVQGTAALLRAFLD
jgi:DNA-binding FadR family transcriptional regulator